MVPGWRCSLAKSDGPLSSLHGRFCWDRGLAWGLSQSEIAVKGFGAARQQERDPLFGWEFGGWVGTGDVRGKELSSKG